MTTPLGSRPGREFLDFILERDTHFHCGCPWSGREEDLVLPENDTGSSWRAYTKLNIEEHKV
jgi:hypothetical protein